MRLSFQTRQVLGVTFIVACSVLTMAIMHVAGQARTLLAESALRGEMLTNSIFQRAFRLAKRRATAAADHQVDGRLPPNRPSAHRSAQAVLIATTHHVI